MHSRLQHCTDCKKKLPPLDEESTLVTMRYGWRLVRSTSTEGGDVLEWRCPTCWAAYRERQAAAPRGRIAHVGTSR